MSTTLQLETYAQCLRSYLHNGTEEVLLLEAYDLGRSLVAEGAGLLEVIRLHSDAVEEVVAEVGDVPRGHAERFLVEVLGPFEMAYLGFQEANASLRSVTASLEEQVAERTRQLQQSVSELQSVDAHRRRLLTRLVEAQEDERHRLANDLHDDTIQVMTGASLRLGTLTRWVAPEGRPVLERVEETVLASIRRLRQLIFELRPPALEGEGLGAAVRIYANEAFPDDGPPVRVDERLVEQPPVAYRETLYRIIQEALANARKHAEATRIDVLVEDDDGGVRVTVADDGSGFDRRVLETPRPGHLGVSAMFERAEVAGGWCEVDSVPGQGTRMVCWVPAHSPPASGGPPGPSSGPGQGRQT